jgi:hypothetical protein
MLREIVGHSYWMMARASKPNEFPTLAEILEINTTHPEETVDALWEALGSDHADEFIDCWDGPLLADLDKAFVKVYVTESKELHLHFGARTPEVRQLWASYVAAVMAILVEHDSNTISFPALLTAKMAFQLHWKDDDDDVPVPILTSSYIDAYQSILEKLQAAIREVSHVPIVFISISRETPTQRFRPLCGQHNRSGTRTTLLSCRIAFQIDMRSIIFRTCPRSVSNRYAVNINSRDCRAGAAYRFRTICGCYLAPCTANPRATFPSATRPAHPLWNMDNVT